ncbi:hypothetical protein MKX08_005408 [Trichoderma sp. CBMAI-0020]|nr:hypothetical protein MKX08_005408 [Trichoderma sp. CBMAI-0020]
MKEKTNLLLAVSHVAALRQQETKRQREEQQEREHNQKELILKAEEEEAKEEEKEKTKLQELEATLAKERVEAWKRIHDAKARRNYFSRAQVDEEVMRMVEQVDRDLGLAKRRMEDGTEEPHEEWRARMLVLRIAIYRLWNENEERIRGALPRYVEGVAVRDGIEPPKFLGERRTRISGLGACFQCLMEGMACSRGVVTRRGQGAEKKGCERCERKGHRCIVEYGVNGDDEGDNNKEKVYEWGWVDEACDGEPVEATLEMWKRRKRGDRLEVIGGGTQWVEAGGFALPSCEKVRKPVEG